MNGYSLSMICCRIQCLPSFGEHLCSFSIILLFGNETILIVLDGVMIYMVDIGKEESRKRSGGNRKGDE